MMDYENIYGNVERITDYVDQNECNVYEDVAYIDRINDGYMLHGFTC